MRAAAFTSGAIIAIGLYLIIAVAAGLTPAVMGLGILAIALVAALGLMATAPTRVQAARAG